MQRLNTPRMILASTLLALALGFTAPLAAEPPAAADTPAAWAQAEAWLAGLWAPFRGLFDSGAGDPPQHSVAAAAEGDEDYGPFIDPNGFGLPTDGDEDVGPFIDPDGLVAPPAP